MSACHVTEVIDYLDGSCLMGQDIGTWIGRSAKQMATSRAKVWQAGGYSSVEVHHKPEGGVSVIMALRDYPPTVHVRRTYRDVPESEALYLVTDKAAL